MIAVRHFLRSLLVASLTAGWCHADDDHDRARQAFEAGEVLPLTTIMQRVERAYPGQVIEAELERRHGRWIYEIKVLLRSGALKKLRVDARDGTLLDAKGHASAAGGDN